MGASNSTNNNLIISQYDDGILRHLTSDDAVKAKELAVISFPIYYPMDYFLETFNNKNRYFSVGILSSTKADGELYGFMIALPNYVDDVFRAQFYSEPEKALISRFNSKIAYISLIAVNPTSMRKGYGTILVNSLIDACLKWNPKPEALFLHVKSDNSKAIKFYEKMGFVQDSLVKDYYSEDSHAYIYVRILEPANIINNNITSK